MCDTELLVTVLYRILAEYIILVYVFLLLAQTLMEKLYFVYLILFMI